MTHRTVQKKSDYSAFIWHHLLLHEWTPVVGSSRPICGGQASLSSPCRFVVLFPSVTYFIMFLPAHNPPRAAWGVASSGSKPPGLSSPEVNAVGKLNPECSCASLPTRLSPMIWTRVNQSEKCPPLIQKPPPHHPFCLCLENMWTASTLDKARKGSESATCLWMVEGDSYVKSLCQSMLGPFLGRT